MIGSTVEMNPPASLARPLLDSSLRPPSPRPSHRGLVSMHDLIPLAQLSTGRKASVGVVLGLPDDVRRIEELGLRCGTVVEMVQSGSPCIIRLAGTKLCFRSDDLLSVLVAPENEA
jgi:ferrous iron transport protein A